MVASREYCTQERYTPSRIPSFAFQPTLRRPQCDVTPTSRQTREGAISQPEGALRLRRAREQQEGIESHLDGAQ